MRRRLCADRVQDSHAVASVSVLRAGPIATRPAAERAAWTVSANHTPVTRQCGQLGPRNHNRHHEYIHDIEEQPRRVNVDVNFGARSQQKQTWTVSRTAWISIEPTSAGARSIASAYPQHQRQSFPDKQASRLELQRGPTVWRTSVFGATFGQRRRLTPRTTPAYGRYNHTREGLAAYARRPGSTCLPSTGAAVQSPAARALLRLSSPHHAAASLFRGHLTELQ